MKREEGSDDKVEKMASGINGNGYDCQFGIRLQQ